MKVCLQPWNQLHINLPNSIGLCCIKPKTNTCISYETIEESDFAFVVNRPEILSLRRAFLAEQIPTYCLGCGNMTEFDSLECFSKFLLKKGIILNKEIPDKIDSISELCVEFTSYCNFKCLYCIRSNPFFDNYSSYLPIEKFYDLLKRVCAQQKISQLTTIGIGEFTVHPQWQQIVKYVTNEYPHIKFNIFTNLGKQFTDTEIAVLCKAHMITISCDTNDSDLFKKLRSGDLSVVVGNLKRIKDYKDSRESACPTVTVACVLNSESIKTLHDFVQFLSQNKLCEQLMLSPMNLPKSYSKRIGIYPIDLLDKETSLSIVKAKRYCEENGMECILNGDFSGLSDE